jgi:hypothetical protein
VDLAADEGEAGAKFGQEVRDVLDDGRLDLALLCLSAQCEEVEPV